MSNKTIDIRYSFRFAARPPEIIDLQLDPLTLAVVNRPVSDAPEWARLAYHQCPHCPLDVGKIRDCPVAVSMVDVVHRFYDVKSHEVVDLEVVSVERKISQRTVAQKGISSLLGLLISTSGCPHTDFFKPMARYHLPLASEEETVFRVSGMFLLGQYFRNQNGQPETLELHGLRQIYANMHLLNGKISERLRCAIREDSSLNAVIVLDVFAHTFEYALEEDLVDLQRLFLPYLAGSHHGAGADGARAREGENARKSGERPEDLAAGKRSVKPESGS
jgi:hypothetical protein